jgi:hypothetical protein
LAHVRAQRLFAELLAQTESARRTLHDQPLETAIEYKVSWERELRRRDALGISDLPDPLPHPDHVQVDFRAGTVRFAGPMSKEEKAEWDDILARREILRDGIAGLTEALETEEDPNERADIEWHIRQGKEALARIARVIPAE